MEIGEREAHFLTLCQRVLDEEEQDNPGMDFFDCDIPIKKLRRTGLREDELQRVAQSLEMKGLVKLQFNHRDELKRLCLRPTAQTALEKYLAAKVGEGEKMPVKDAGGDPGGVIRSLAKKIALAERAGHEWSALNTMVEALLQGEVPGDQTVFLEHLDVLVQQALLAGNERRPSVVETLMERMETLLPPSAGQVRTAWEALKQTIQG